MRVIASYFEATEAYIAASVLDAEGIPFEIRDEHVVGVGWLYSQATGGVKLLVPDDVADRAAALLGADRSAAVPDDPDAIRCPACGSADVRSADLRRRALALGLLLGLPLTARSGRLRCRACGKRWWPAPDSPVSRPAERPSER
jgi:hypothetical protein